MPDARRIACEQPHTTAGAREKNVSPDVIWFIPRRRRRALGIFAGPALRPGAVQISGGSDDPPGIVSTSRRVGRPGGSGGDRSGAGGIRLAIAVGPALVGPDRLSAQLPCPRLRRRLRVRALMFVALHAMVTARPTAVPVRNARRCELVHPSCRAERLRIFAIRPRPARGCLAPRITPPCPGSPRSGPLS